MEFEVQYEQIIPIYKFTSESMAISVALFSMACLFMMFPELSSLHHNLNGFFELLIDWLGSWSGVNY